MSVTSLSCSGILFGPCMVFYVALEPDRLEEGEMEERLAAA